MKFHKGLIIILILFFISSISSHFNDSNSQIDSSQDRIERIVSSMLSEVNSDILMTAKDIPNVKAIYISVLKDYYPYAFVNSDGQYDGSYIRILEKLGEQIHCPVYFKIEDLGGLNNQQIIKLDITSENTSENNSENDNILKPRIETVSEDESESESESGLENSQSNWISDVLDKIIASNEMEELSSEISKVYRFNYDQVKNPINYMKVIEIILILVPFSWIILFKFLSMRSEKLSASDFLTKLSNRRALEKRKLNYDIDTTTAIYLDLDNLKKINDTINHKEGDKLIVNFAERLKSICPEKHIYRVGGDEFIILYKGEITPLLNDLANILHNDTDALEIDQFSFSAGVVEMKRLGISSIDEAVNIADYTMYEAKNAGKCNILRADKKMVEDFRLTNYIKLNLERTCETKSFIPFFQPIIDGETGQIKGFEALVRMKVVNGYAPNDHLIKQARELNLLSKIDIQMYEESMKFARILLDKNIANENWIFNSNFSAHTLSKLKIEQLKQIADKYGIQPSQIVIEITEDELLEKSIQDFLANCKKYGFKIAIDDFGAAYSSFVRLLEIKPDIMKIDRSLLPLDISSNRDVQNIYNNIVHLGRDLDSMITAEGVENIDQISLLKSLGVETLQGFHYSKPLPMDEFLLYAEKSLEIRTC